jgi:hypothetical protein
MINSGLINSHLINAAAGPDAFENVLETAVITSSMVASNSGPFEVTETAVIVSSDPVLVTIADVAETAVIANPEPVQMLSDTITETAGIAATAYASNDTYEDVSETAVLNDAVSLSIITDLDVAEAAVITSSVTLPTPYHDVSETAVITSAATISASGVLDVTETAVITSDAATGQNEDVAETAVITSAVTAANTSTLDIAETAVITGSDVLISNNVLDIYETAVIESLVSHRADTVTDITEEGFISSEVYISADADVFTANTFNWAMSTYTGLTFTGASDDYAVSADGLFLKNTSYADMNMATGRSDLGSDMLKALPHAYVYAEHRAPMEIRVTADVLGEEATSGYIQMARDATDTRSIRCTFGRGFRSSYYKLNFISSGYAQVRNCTPIVDELSRRI